MVGRHTLSLLGIAFWFGLRTLGGELPVETFFKKHEFAKAKLSPDGKALAFLGAQNRRLRLGVIDLDQRTLKRAAFSLDQDIYDFVWAKNDRLLFWFSKDGFASGGLYAVNRDGSNPVVLDPSGSNRLHLLDLLEDNPKEILVESSYFAHEAIERDAVILFPHVVRLNVYNGARAREVDNPGRVHDYLTDHRGIVRVALANEGFKEKLLYRQTATAPWMELAERELTGDGMAPLGFDADDQTLFVASNIGRETDAVCAYDPRGRQLKEVIHGRDDVDVNGIRYSHVKQKLTGIEYITDREQVHWLDPDRRQFQLAIDKALTNTHNVIKGFDRSEGRAIIFGYSDRWPGTYYLFDRARRKFEKISDVAGWIPLEEMTEMKPIQYRARDGLTIRGYLFLPKGSDGKRLPLVVNPHGGPFDRDVWEFDPEAQFLANRGYAVLRVNFRGSVGYGKTFRRAGYRQWGQKMQDDITDGVRWVVAERIADPNRVAIFGTSYGGYAAMAGLVFTPELYRCGINCCGVTDLNRLLKDSLFHRSKLTRRLYREVLGDPRTDKEWLQSVSPLNHVEKIQAPVLLAYGGLDPRVHVAHGRMLAKELEHHGKPYELIIKEDEGHGFHKEENQIEFYRRVETFLKRHLAPR